MYLVLPSRFLRNSLRVFFDHLTKDFFQNQITTYGQQPLVITSNTCLKYVLQQNIKIISKNICSIPKKERYLQCKTLL